MRSVWFAPVCIVAMVAFSLAVYGQLPDRVATHWGIDGTANGWSSRRAAAAGLPLTVAGIWLLLTFLPRIDPRRAAYVAFAPTYRLFVNVVVLFLAAMHVIVLGKALGWDLSVERLAPVGVGLLFAVLGNELGRVQPNWFVGIRTPWTLSDPEVWRRTHRVGGRVMVVTGLLIALAGLVLPPSLGMIVLLVGAVGSALGLAAYSYVLWRRLQPGSGHGVTPA